jgi:hypothetical protein
MQKFVGACPSVPGLDSHQDQQPLVDSAYHLTCYFDTRAAHALQ